MAKPKEELTEGQALVTLPEGMTPEDFAKLLVNFSKKEKKSLQKDESIVFKTIERGPGKEIRVSRDTYKGRTYNSIKEWYTDGDSGELRPGRGVTFTYEDIDEMIEGLTELGTYLEDHLEDKGD